MFQSEKMPKGSPKKKAAPPAKASSPAKAKSPSPMKGSGKSPPVNLEKSQNSNFLTVGRRNKGSQNNVKISYMSVWVVRHGPKASCIAMAVMTGQIGDNVVELIKNCWSAKVFDDMAKAGQIPSLDFSSDKHELCMENDEVLHNTAGYPIRVQVLPTANPPSSQSLKDLTEWICEEVNANPLMEGRNGYASNRLEVGDRWLVNDDAVYGDFLTADATVAMAKSLFDVDAVENWGMNTIGDPQYAFFRPEGFPLEAARQLGVSTADVLPDEREELMEAEAEDGEGNNAAEGGN